MSFVKTEFEIFQSALRDCFEGCIPWRDAIEMIGAPDEYRAELKKSWNGWNRKFQASQMGW